MRIFLTHHEKWCVKETSEIIDILYPQRVHWDPRTYKNAKTGMVYPPHRVADRVLTGSVNEYIVKHPVKKTAFILAGGNCIFGGEGKKFSQDNELSYEYKVLPLSLTHIYAGKIASTFGDVAHCVTDATACVSSLKCLFDVQTLIKHYGFERVIVLGVEDQVNNMTLQFFGEAGACLTLKNEADHGVVPSAFDSQNFGFYIGQGAALAIFESEEAVMKNGPPTHLELLGAWAASESGANAIGQREDGQGFKNAISGALEISRVNPEQIKIVKTHGTGTKSNNTAEKTALLDMLPDGFVATSYKPQIGHTMGASGLLETLLLMDDLATGIVPAIPNRTEEDATFLSSAKEAPDGLILSLAAGMGNVYAAAIFDRKA